MSNRIGDLEIDQDLAFQRRVWAFQRVGWVAMALVVIGGALGAFGGTGPLAAARVGGDADPLRLEYRRLTRHGAPDHLRIHVGPALASPDSTIALWLAREWVDGMHIREVVPEPVEVSVTDDRVSYRFKLIDPSSPATVRFTTEALLNFARRGAVGIEGGPSHAFTQFVFP